MKYVNGSNIGIDYVINDIQDDLHTIITSQWSGDIDSYGRLYKNRKGDRFVAEYYVSENDYRPIAFNDNKAGQFFFLVGDNPTTEDEVLFSNEVKCVFAVNLVSILGAGRNDQKAHLDALDALRTVNGDYTITGVQTSIDDIFSGYDITNIEKNNIQPKHIFAVTLDLNYYLTNKCV